MYFEDWLYDKDGLPSFTAEWLGDDPLNPPTANLDPLDLETSFFTIGDLCITYGDRELIFENELQLYALAALEGIKEAEDAYNDTVFADLSDLNEKLGPDLYSRFLRLLLLGRNRRAAHLLLNAAVTSAFPSCDTNCFEEFHYTFDRVLRARVRRLFRPQTTSFILPN